MNIKEQLTQEKGLRVSNILKRKTLLSIVIVLTLEGILVTPCYLSKQYQNKLSMLDSAVFAHAPKIATAHAETQREEIDAYIDEVFGESAGDFNKLLDCENHARNPKAKNVNTDAYQSTDWGIAQINDHWQGVTNVAFLTDWKINILMAHNIFVNNGNSFRRWSCAKKVGVS